VACPADEGSEGWAEQCFWPEREERVSSSGGGRTVQGGEHASWPQALGLSLPLLLLQGGREGYHLPSSGPNQAGQVSGVLLLSGF
jgi:hypothetical protein